jgi:hypothetical protein
MALLEREFTPLRKGLHEQTEDLSKKISEEIKRREEGQRDLETRMKEELDLVRGRAEELQQLREKVLIDHESRIINDSEQKQQVREKESKNEREKELQKERERREELERKEEMERKKAESEMKIQRRNMILQGAEEEEDEDEEEKHFNDEEESDESSFLESDDEGREEGDAREDDLSVNSSDSSGSSPQHPMKETSRIEDSLDESMDALETMKQQHKAITPSSTAPALVLPSQRLSYEVDSLGNMIPVNRSREGPQNSSLTSGSLLGSGGRNKAVPLQRFASSSSSHSVSSPHRLFSSSTLPTRSNTSLPPPPASMPLPSATSHSNPPPSRQHQEDTAQCTFCLRRFNIEELKHHLKTCELRTELCQFGCRSRIMASKMEKHHEICPNNPNNKD